jgi:hypothetical protein
MVAELPEPQATENDGVIRCGPLVSMAALMLLPSQFLGLIFMMVPILLVQNNGYNEIAARLAGWLACAIIPAIPQSIELWMCSGERRREQQIGIMLGGLIGSGIAAFIYLLPLIR